MDSWQKCPTCGGPCQLLATTNEFDNYCPKCDIRFNRRGEQPPVSPRAWLKAFRKEVEEMIEVGDPNGEWLLMKVEELERILEVEELAALREGDQ